MAAFDDIQHDVPAHHKGVPERVTDVVLGGNGVNLNRIVGYAKAVSRTALGRVNAGRNLTVLPDDIFLVSYPRSGNTWTRFLIGNLVNGSDPVTFGNIETRVPTIYAWPDRKLRSLPRILKSHEYFDPRYPRVIYILRDPRDVAVSMYYYCLKMRVLEDGYPIDEFALRFIKPNIAPHFDRMGSWEDHVLSWLRMREGKPGFVSLRYEDLKADPARQLTRVAPLLEIEPAPASIERAISMSSAGRMQQMESNQSKDWFLTKKSRQDIKFVREAKAGGWRNELSQASVQAIEDAWGPTMRELGYATS